MKIVARQWRWIMILRVAIGCGVVAMGLQLPWLSVVVMMSESHDWRALRAFIPVGLAMCLAGGYFACYARLEWKPRGIAVGLCRHGLVCKVNYVLCPRLLVIEWPNIEGATYEPPRWFGLCFGRVRVVLRMCLATGTLPTSGGGVVQAGAYIIVLGGWWEAWHPEDVANLIQAAATDEAVRDTLGERQEVLYP